MGEKLIPNNILFTDSININFLNQLKNNILFDTLRVKYIEDIIKNIQYNFGYDNKFYIKYKIKTYFDKLTFLRNNEFLYFEKTIKL